MKKVEETKKHVKRDALRLLQEDELRRVDGGTAISVARPNTPFGYVPPSW